MTSVTILAPAYNEEAVIEDFVEAAAACIEPDWELLIVDDGSSDRTPEILEKLTEKHSTLRIITHPSNSGLGAALSTGMHSAKGDVVVTMDADLTQPFALVKSLVAGCREADAVFASRYVPGGGMLGVPRGRVWASQAGNAVLRVTFGARLRDMTTGFRAYRKSALDLLTIEATGFEAQLEIAVSLLVMNRKINEVPFILGNRRAGESKLMYRKLLVRYAACLPKLLHMRWFRSPR